jgi:hypothetical protein
MLSISATKLTSYTRCPNQNYLRYHKKFGSIPMRSASLDKALHAALSPAKFTAPIPLTAKY